MNNNVREIIKLYVQSFNENKRFFDNEFIDRKVCLVMMDLYRNKMIGFMDACCALDYREDFNKLNKIRRYMNVIYMDRLSK